MSALDAAYQRGYDRGFNRGRLYRDLSGDGAEIVKLQEALQTTTQHRDDLLEQLAVLRTKGAV